TFIFLLLHFAQNVHFAGMSVGWAFFLWPGVIDTIPNLFGKQLLTVPGALLWIATGVGAFAGIVDGFWRIHDWKGLGWLEFPLDVTWGLAGTTNGCLIHLVNIGWGKHADDARTGSHRYESGFCFKGGYAFTQGAVMSSLADAPGTDLYRH